MLGRFLGGLINDNNRRNSNVLQSPKTISVRCRHCGNEYIIPDMFHVERACPQCGCMNIFENGVSQDFSSIVPFDVHTIPDVYVSMQGKIDWRFPDDVGQPGSQLSEELWIHDDYIIRFNLSSLYYVNIVTREYGSVPLDEIRKYLNGKLWVIKALETSGKYQEELMRVYSSSPDVSVIGNTYMGIIQTIILHGMSSEQHKALEESIAKIERLTGAEYAGRKWTLDGKSITWGKLLHAIFMSCGMKKVY